MTEAAGNVAVLVVTKLPVIETGFAGLNAGPVVPTLAGVVNVVVVTKENRLDVPWTVSVSTVIVPPHDKAYG
jgi:hypothetical protein